MTALDTIVCCVDDSPAAGRALEHAIALRERVGGALTVVHVVAPPAFLVSLAAGLGGAPVHDDRAEREAARVWLKSLAEGAGAEAVLLEGHPADTLCDWVAENGGDVIVVARHRGRIESALLGSFARHLSQHAPCPVLLIPPAHPEGD